MAINYKLSGLIFLFVALIMAAAPIAQAQLGGVIGQINGTIYCSVNASIGVVNGTAVPAFSDADVLLQCGQTVVANVTTNANGTFSIGLNATLNIIGLLLTDGCKVVVTTPLVTCNATLPAGGVLFSDVSVLSFIEGLLKFIANAFTYSSSPIITIS